MSLTTFSYCPFRVQTFNYQAGCTLQFGTKTKCYTQEKRPLLKDNNSFICPKMGIQISLKICNQLETLINPLTIIQDEYEIAINVWPTLMGIANPRNAADTQMGTRLVELAKHIQDELNEIILDLD